MRFGVACLLLALTLAPEAAGQTGHYRPGQNELRSSFVPERGFHFTGRSFTFTSNTLIGDDGGRLDEVTVRIPPFSGREITLDLDVRLEASNAIGTAAFVPLDLEGLGLRYGFAVSGRASQGEAETGVLLVRSVGQTGLRLGDPQVTPVWVGWRSDHVQLSASYSAWLPLGGYDPANVVNSGGGFWTQQLQATIGVFYDAEHFGGLILRTTYQANHTAVDGRPYVPGNALTFEYGWSQDLVRYRGLAFGIGISGSSEVQVSANQVSRRDLGRLLGGGPVGRFLDKKLAALRSRRAFVHAVGGELTIRDEAGISFSLLGSYDYSVQAGLQGFRIGLSFRVQLGVLRERRPPE